MSERVVSDSSWATGLVTGEVDELALHVAREAGAWGNGPPAERRAIALLALALLEAHGEGATRLAMAALPARLARIGAAATDVRQLLALLESAPSPGTSSLIGGPGAYRPFVVDGGYLYDERNFRLETRLADRLAERLGRPERTLAPTAVLAAVEAAGRAVGRAWTGSQTAAIGAALRRPLTLISGGPGTGKTALIAGLVHAFGALGIPPESIAIAAPTGRAASRIAELAPWHATGTSTLHRLLGFLGGRATTRRGLFRRHENRPLPHAVVIVDEASMVGMALAEQLVRAISPDAQLVLVGDADQLPAVDAGGVLRDLAPLAVRLTESHRMDPSDPAGAALLEAAQAVAAGSLGDRGGPPARRPSDLPASGFSRLEAGDAESPAAARRLLAAFLDHWRATHLAPVGEAQTRVFALAAGDEARLDAHDEPAVAALLNRLGRARILTVTRQGPAGCDTVNAALASRTGEDPGSPLSRAAHPSWRPERRCSSPGTTTNAASSMARRAIVVTAAAPGSAPTLRVAFRRGAGLAVFSLASLRGALDLAYASTVHKAQGSELDHAALLLPDGDLPLLSRELVYTAMTRARRSLVVVGPRAVLNSAVARPLDRASGLRDRLLARGALPRGESAPRRRAPSVTPIRPSITRP